MKVTAFLQLFTLKETDTEATLDSQTTSKSHFGLGLSFLGNIEWGLITSTHSSLNAASFNIAYTWKAYHWLLSRNTTFF